MDQGKNQMKQKFIILMLFNSLFQLDFRQQCITFLDPIPKCFWQKDVSPFTQGVLVSFRTFKLKRILFLGYQHNINLVHSHLCILSLETMKANIINATLSNFEYDGILNTPNCIYAGIAGYDQKQSSHVHLKTECVQQRYERTEHQVPSVRSCVYASKIQTFLVNLMIVSPPQLMAAMPWVAPPIGTFWHLFICFGIYWKTE